MHTCLVVDDDQVIRELIVEMLDSKDFSFIEAENGNDALKVLNEKQVDLLISDLVMPGKNGLDLIMEASEKFKELKVIAMSGGGGITGSFDYLPVAGLLGAAKILNKPFTPIQLRSMVNELLG
jgi:DNA-binding NtrC family response regulator